MKGETMPRKRSQKAMIREALELGFTIDEDWTLGWYGCKQPARRICEIRADLRNEGSPNTIETIDVEVPGRGGVKATIANYVMRQPQTEEKS